MLKKTERLLIAVVIFVASVLIFTCLDYLVNSDLYSFGLQFSNGWYSTYSFLYMALYQIVLVCLLLYSRSAKLFVVLEAFVLSAGPDLVYFGLWNHGVFPSGNWTWMQNYQLFGVWTTEMQFVFSGFALLLGGLVAYFLPRRITDIKVP
jgi:hypothetical protein